jgi:hypothetical protein
MKKYRDLLQTSRHLNSLLGTSLNYTDIHATKIYILKNLLRAKKIYGKPKCLVDGVYVCVAYFNRLHLHAQNVNNVIRFMI